MIGGIGLEEVAVDGDTEVFSTREGTQTGKPSEVVPEREGKAAISGHTSVVSAACPKEGLLRCVRGADRPETVRASAKRLHC